VIYKIYLIDGDNGISLLESSFKEFRQEKQDHDLIPHFFNEINKIIDSIQEAMAKGQKKEEMIRILESEYSIIIIFFHPPSRILFCSISDADDDIDKLIEVIQKISNRFWKKHKSDIQIFRTTTEKSRFQTIMADIENLTNGGKIAEIFPKSIVVKNVLEKILNMGMINEAEFHVALKCTGDLSPLGIAKLMHKTRSDVMDSLKKLAELDIIEM
jgi:hypothetical protein